MAKGTRVDGGIRTEKGTFLPLRKIRGGQEYLEVKYRLVWFREDMPEASIQTMYVDLGPDHAVAKATIGVMTDKGAIVLATSHKREDKKGFEDFMEKAETGAIGRALAAIGYGTQYGTELEEGARIVDAPVEAVGTTVAPIAAVEATSSNGAASRGFRKLTKPAVAAASAEENF